MPPIIKSKSEVDRIRESSQIVADVLRLIEKYIVVGATTLELDEIAEDFILTCGAKPAFKGVRIDKYVFPSTLCVSLNEEVVHGIPNSEIKLREGDIVSVDVGAVKNGYFGDGAKTFAVGNISDEKRKLMEITEKSLYLGIDKARAGNRLYDISKAIQDEVEINGYSIVRELCGHGIGKSLWESPQVLNYIPKGSSKKRNIFLQEGMTIAIEPMVNMGKHDVKTKKDGWTVFAADMLPSAHFEHTILIRDGEPEILTK